MALNHINPILWHLIQLWTQVSQFSFWWKKLLAILASLHRLQWRKKRRETFWLAVPSGLGFESMYNPYNPIWSLWLDYKWSLWVEYTTFMGTDWPGLFTTDKASTMILRAMHPTSQNCFTIQWWKEGAINGAFGVPIFPIYSLYIPLEFLNHLIV